MFKKRDPQHTIFETSYLIPSAKLERLEKSWAEAFRTQALPLIEEARFAPMYCDHNGRPNIPVQIVLGTLILKEMFNLTDQECLEQVEFNLLWQHALCVTPEEAHLCQKTLHNFRVRMIEHDFARLAFQTITDRIIEAGGVKVTRQRLDSTHIVSNIAILTRLGLFCETLRVFLSALKKEHPIRFKKIPEGLLRRYLKENGTASRYGDVPSSRARRRLAVCGRDVYRLVDHFRGTEVSGLEQYALLERILEEQCDVLTQPEHPKKDDDDATEGGIPVRVKAAKEVRSDSLQTPHDPDVTYSGHKGKGYEVQVAETCDEENNMQVITAVEVSASSSRDTDATIPVLEELQERDLQPNEMSADTAYGSGSNAVEAEKLGTKLISPVAGRPPAEEDSSDEADPLTASDFSIDPSYTRPTICPAGHESLGEWEDANSSNKVEIHFCKQTCDDCPQFSRCPVNASPAGATYVLYTDLVKVNIAQRRRFEGTAAFASQYSIRAGIEATNSELKRKHGMGRLRVREKSRVELSVFMKSLSCNIKRFVRHVIASVSENLSFGV